MNTYPVSTVLLSLTINMQYYEQNEEWDKLDNSMALFNYVKHNGIIGTIDLTPEQQEVYYFGENDDLYTVF